MTRFQVDSDAVAVATSTVRSAMGRIQGEVAGLHGAARRAAEHVDRAGLGGVPDGRERLEAHAAAGRREPRDAGGGSRPGGTAVRGGRGAERAPVPALTRASPAEPRGRARRDPRNATTANAPATTTRGATLPQRNGSAPGRAQAPRRRRSLRACTAKAIAIEPDGRGIVQATRAEREHGDTELGGAEKIREQIRRVAGARCSRPTGCRAGASISAMPAAARRVAPVECARLHPDEQGPRCSIATQTCSLDEAGGSSEEEPPAFV